MDVKTGMPNSPKSLAAVTVDLVRDTSRRLSMDLRDMGRDFSREVREMGREIRDIHREIGHRIRSSSLQPLPRIEMPRIAFPSLTAGANYEFSVDNLTLPPGSLQLFNSTTRNCTPH